MPRSNVVTIRISEDERGRLERFAASVGGIALGEALRQLVRVDAFGTATGALRIPIAARSRARSRSDEVPMRLGDVELDAARRRAERSTVDVSTYVRALLMRATEAPAPT